MDKQKKLIIAIVLTIGAIVTIVLFKHNMAKNKPTKEEPYVISVIKGDSMQPFFYDGDRVKQIECDKYEAGDIISVVNFEGDTSIIKRVIAVPGDSVSIKDGWVYVNGATTPYQKLKYIPTTTEMDGALYTNVDNQKYLDAPEITLKENEYYLLGDNTLHSGDSRSFGPVNISRFLTYKSVAKIIDGKEYPIE